MCMDLITSVPESQRYDAILLMIKRLAKLAHMVPIVGTATASETALFFLNGWLRHHGLPIVFMSDRYPKLTNTFWRHFSREVRMKLWFSMAFHSQLDGKIECMNELLKQYLRNKVGASKENMWVQWS